MKRQQQRIEWRQNQTPKVDAEMTIDPCRQRFVHSLGDRTHSSASDPGPPGTSEMGRGSSQVAQIIPDPRLVRQCEMRRGPEVNVLLLCLGAPILGRSWKHQPRHAAYNVSFMSERDVFLQIRPLQTETSWSEWKSLQWWSSWHESESQRHAKATPQESYGLIAVKPIAFDSHDLFHPLHLFRLHPKCGPEW